jgi:hypothetical protein
MRDDPFADLNNLRLTPDTATALGREAAAKQKRASPKRHRQQFVKVTWAWIEHLKGARLPATHMVGYLILYQHWKTGGQPVPVSTVALRALGVSRWAKWRALKELEQLGMVRVQKHPRRAPRATVLGNLAADTRQE